MDQKLVNLFVPALQQSFDLIVPTSVSVEILTGWLTKCVHELSEGKYIISGQEKLCTKNPDVLLKENQTLAECCIINGTHLVLF